MQTFCSLFLWATVGNLVRKCLMETLQWVKMIRHQIFITIIKISEALWLSKGWRLILTHSSRVHISKGSRFRVFTVRWALWIWSQMMAYLLAEPWGGTANFIAQGGSTLTTSSHLITSPKPTLLLSLTQIFEDQTVESKRTNIQTI